MISLKKVIVAAVIAAMGFGLFAQESKTNTATAELFKTDVDNFVDVNEWSTVEPDKFFGYFGMDNNMYNIGFAKQFSKFYWGTYYCGDINSYSKVTDESTKTNSETENSSLIRFDNLFGFGNIGLKLSTFFAGSKTVNEDTDAKITKTVDGKVFYGRVDIGLANFELGKLNTKPYAYISYNTNDNWGTKTEETDKDTVDNRKKSFAIGAGAEIIFSESETTKQSLSTSVNFINYTPYDTDLVSKGTYFSLPLFYEVTYKATDTLALAFGAGANTSYSVDDNSKSKTKVDTFRFNPAIATGLTFDTKKKVILNAGVQFAIPSYTDKKTDIDGKVKTEKDWDGTDCDLTWCSGFNWVPTKNISVDCSYKILADLLNKNTTNNDDTDMTTNFREGNGTNFWNTVNQVLVHNIGFSVSVKF